MFIILPWTSVLPLMMVTHQAVHLFHLLCRLLWGWRFPSSSPSVVQIHLCLCFSIFVFFVFHAAYLSYCNRVGWTLWDWRLVLRTPSSFSALTLLIGSRNNPSPIWPIVCVWWDVKPYSTQPDSWYLSTISLHSSFIGDPVQCLKPTVHCTRSNQYSDLFLTVASSMPNTLFSL